MYKYQIIYVYVNVRGIHSPCFGGVNISKNILKDVMHKYIFRFHGTNRDNSLGISKLWWLYLTETIYLSNIVMFPVTKITASEHQCCLQEWLKKKTLYNNIIFCPTLIWLFSTPNQRCINSHITQQLSISNVISTSTVTDIHMAMIKKVKIIQDEILWCFSKSTFHLYKEFVYYLIILIETLK